MAKIIKNPKGFLMIALSLEEAIKVAPSIQCKECGELMTTTCYVAALNKFVCPNCMRKFVYTNKRTNVFQESVNYNIIASKLNMPYADSSGNLLTYKR